MKNRVSNLPTTRIFDNNETNIISPSDDKYANGWEYLDKAFCEYFNFFWNDTSKNFNKINPFLNDFNDEITNMVSLMKSEGMTDSSFDTAQNNWFGKVGQWLSQRIKEEASNRESSITSESNTLKNLISSEQSARISADEALQKAIDKEVGDRQNAVSSEASARSSADTAIRSSLETEITNRQNADNELKTYINGKVPQATSSVAGIMKLFTSLGRNTDGAPTNKLLQDQLNTKSNTSHNHDGRYAKGLSSEKKYTYTRNSNITSMNLEAIGVGEMQTHSITLRSNGSEEQNYGFSVKTPTTGMYMVWGFPSYYTNSGFIAGSGVVGGNIVIGNTSSLDDADITYKCILYRVA